MLTGFWSTPSIIRDRLSALLRVFPASDSPAPATTMRDVWLPPNGEPLVLLRWLFTEWCNYRCPYCPQTHGRREPKGNGLTAHGFDNFPIERWIEAFDRHFSTQRLSMVLTGGETMLDRKNITKLLNHLSKKDNVECIRVDTNAWWKPSQFPDLIKDKLILMCTFHPSQTGEDEFFDRVESYLSAKFTIGMVNYVMDHDNIPKFNRLKKRFHEIGLILHPNPLWGSSGQYSDEVLATMREALPDVDYELRTGATDPFHKPCYFPAVSYEMDLKGQIHVGCMNDRIGSFFDEVLPQRPDDKVPCPFNSCVCLDKYSFLDGVQRNVSANPLAEYRRALLERT